ncbi:MAG: hypothetical protein O2954_15540, partial [bacterium]|nr:hypothetical protein [bacterium]
QLQRASRPLENTPSYTDLYAQVSWQHPSGFGAALVMDRTTDPLEVDDAATLDRVETGARTLWATNLNAQFRGHYEVLLFAGKRRGGTACTSGTCYQVLPFTGVELRLSTHF